MGSTWEKADYPPGHSACRRAGKYGGLALDVLDSIITWERRHTASGMSPPCLKSALTAKSAPSPNSTLLGRDSTRECCRQRASFPSSPRETLCWSTPGNGIASSCSHFSRRRLSRGQPSERHTNIGRQPVQQRHWSERLLPRSFSMHFSAWRHTAVCAIDLNLPEFPFDPAPILVAGRALLISEQSPSLPGLNPDNSAAMY